MIHFPCAHCAADIRVHERATEATCPACQTPQSIPETAAPVSAPMLDRSRTRMDGKPLDFETPRYAGALFTAAGLIMGGVFAILWGIIAFLSPNLLAGLILVGAGLFALTLGQILALVRTIAQQTAPH